MSPDPKSVPLVPAESASDDRELYISVLREFSTYGFRRTSMVGLAEAAGVSRQTLYNRFAKKDAVLEWAVTGFSRIVRRDAVSFLRADDGAPGEVIEETFWRWLGTIAVMLHEQRFAEEILGLSKASLKRQVADPLEAIADELTAYLLEHGLRTTKDDAAAAAYLLAMSAKGLMHTCGTEAAFRAGMRRVLAGGKLT